MNIIRCTAEPTLRPPPEEHLGEPHFKPTGLLDTAAMPVWQRVESLPHVMVWRLSIDRGFTTLAASTRVGGAWAWPLPTAPNNDTIFKDGFDPPP